MSVFSFQLFLDMENADGLPFIHESACACVCVGGGGGGLRDAPPLSSSPPPVSCSLGIEQLTRCEGSTGDTPPGHGHMAIYQRMSTRCEGLRYVGAHARGSPTPQVRFMKWSCHMSLNQLYSCRLMPPEGLLSLLCHVDINILAVSHIVDFKKLPCLPGSLIASCHLHGSAPESAPSVDVPCDVVIVLALGPALGASSL